MDGKTLTIAWNVVNAKNAYRQITYNEKVFMKKVEFGTRQPRNLLNFNRITTVQ